MRKIKRRRHREEEMNSRLEEGCGKMFSEKRGFVGRPYKYPCVNGHLCPECRKAIQDGKGRKK